MTGLTNGTAYTFRVTARQRRRQQPRVGRVQRRDARRPRSSTSPRPSSDDSGDPNGVELGVKFKPDIGRLDHRHPLLQGGRQQRHPHRQPVDARRPAARPGDVQRRERVRVADGDVLHARSPSPPASPTWRPTTPRSGTTPRPPAASARPWTTRRCTPSRNSTVANGVYAYGAASSFPSNTWGATNYWVDVMYALPKPGQVTGATATAGGSTSAKVTWTAPSDGGPVSSLPDHAVRRLDRVRRRSP